MIEKPVACGFDTKMRNTANLPKPGGFRVEYKCPNCDTKFTPFIKYKDLNYCYNCGQSLWWGGVILYINSRLSNFLLDSKKKLGDGKDYHNVEFGLLKGINDENEKDNSSGSDPVFIREEE